MEPLAEQLARELRDPRHTLPVSADPLPGLLRGIQRRQRRRTAAILSSATLTVALVAVGSVALGTQNGPAARPAPLTHSPSAPARTAGTPAATASAAPSTPATVGPPVPAGFTGADLTFVSDTRGWALGSAPCRQEPCTSLLRSADGGRTWSGGPAPVALLAQTGTSCGSGPCISSLRFGDALHGYAFGNGPLLTTSDGGQHWTDVPGPSTTSLEPSGGDLLRVVTGQPGCPPGCTFSVQRANTLTGPWATVSAPPLDGVRTLLLRSRDEAYVLAFGNPAGGSGSARAAVIASADRGRTWTARTDPCSPAAQDSPTESDAVSAAIGPDGSLAVLCQARLSGGPVTVRVSHDSGATYGAVSTLPGGVRGQQIAVSSSALVAQVETAGRSRLLRSTDDGRTWSQVASASAGPGSGFLAFSSGSLGRWLPVGSQTVWTTNDGGATWTSHTFRR